MSKEILLGYLTETTKESRNSLVLKGIVDLLTNIVEEHYNKPIPTQVHIKCPPAIVELATKMDSPDYKNQLEQARRNCDHFASLHSEISVKYAEVCKKNEMCLNDLDEQEEELDKLKKQIEELKTEKQVILVENQRVDKLNRDLQKEKFDLQEQKNNVSEMFEAANKKQKELQNKLNFIDQDYVQFQRSLNHLKETCKGQDVQYNLLQQGYNEVAEERDQFQEQVKNLQTINEELKQTNEEQTYLKSKLENALQENYKLRAAVRAPENFKVVQTAYIQDYENLKAAHDILIQSHRILEQEKIKFLQDISQLIEDKKHLTETYETTFKRMCYLEDLHKNDNCLKDVQRLCEEKEVLQESLNRMTEKYDNLRKECLGLQKTINDLLGRIPVNVPTPFDGNN